MSDNNVTREAGEDENVFHLQVPDSVTGILIWGHRGWIGSEICNVLEGSLNLKVIRAFTRPGQSSLAEVRDELHTAVMHQHVSHVFCLLGFTHTDEVCNIDALEGGPAMTHRNVRDNLFAPVTLAMLCREYRVHFTYFGTGCIFGPESYQREPAGVHWLDSPTFHNSSYSAVKGHTDQLMAVMIQLEKDRQFMELQQQGHLPLPPSSPAFRSNGGILNIRLRMPLMVMGTHQIPTTENDNATPLPPARDLIDKLVRHTELTALPNSVSNLDDLLSLAIILALSSSTGTVHLVNRDTISPPEVMRIYREMINPSHPVQKEVTQQELRARKKIIAERSDCRLDPQCPLLNPYMFAITTAEDAIRRSCTLRCPSTSSSPAPTSPASP